MAWLLFLDESGHDHQQMPYEVRGGVALKDSRLWQFTRAMRQLEEQAFGCTLAEFGRELKGCTLLDRKRFKFAGQLPSLDAEARRRHCRAFLTKGTRHASPSFVEFAAYGHACLEMARGIFQLLRDQQAVVFACMIPRGSGRNVQCDEEFLRKDQVFLLERYFYFLEKERESGLLVFDAVEKQADRTFVRRLESYFIKTSTGRFRTEWIVPAPFFVSSDMAYPLQAADLCIYCINWAYRLPTQGMDMPVREEIRAEFGEWLRRLQFRGRGERDGKTFDTWGICFVPNPTGAGRA